jgi:class 3 adenylate cyclase/tetratricopeptide (TPR) repeat protein
VQICQVCRRDNPDSAHFCSACGATLGDSGSAVRDTSETRKVVTAIFCDVTGSTALGDRLDPESLRQVLAQYFAAMRHVIEMHGGTVEKFIGDAVMAIFGVPVLHEDDAMRAVRAASKMLESLVSLNDRLEREYGISLQVRIGIDTGEAVTGTEERLATGDMVNMAARLEQSADPGQILIGEQTMRLTRSAVDVEPIEELMVKGKSLPLRAYRVVAVRAETDVIRPANSPLLGRDMDLQRLREAFADAVSQRICRLFTILGPAGVGKTRLTRELWSPADGVTLLEGRCLPYGEGITYWPLVQAIGPLLRRLPDLDLDPMATATIERLLAGDSITTDEIAWAFRHLLETAAAITPVVVQFDDIQWGEDAFLDLIEHFALVSRNAPVLVLCVARPELLDKRPAWIADLRLAPLQQAEVERLIEHRLDGAEISSEVREQILMAAGGNPLFVEEMTAMVRTSEDTHVLTPPTIQALLAARLDQLEPGERLIMQRASIEGEVFHRGAIQALLPDDRSITSRLTALVRKELVVPEVAQLPGDDAFRFRHLLIRNAAYESMPKAVRAEMHERFAGWLEGRTVGSLPEAEAILGHHLAEAYGYRAALGPLDDHGREVGLRAGTLLASAGNRSMARGDASAAVSLMERSISVTPSGAPLRLQVMVRLGHALQLRDASQRAIEVLDDAIATAVSMGERAIELRARITRALVFDIADPVGSEGQLLHEAEAAIPELERLGDDEGLANAWRAIGLVSLELMRHAAMTEALERSSIHARRAGDDATAAENDQWMLQAMAYGPTPASQMVRTAEEMSRDGPHTPLHEWAWLKHAAGAAALQGRFTDARELLARVQRVGEAGLGRADALAGVSGVGFQIEMLAGDAAAAGRQARWGYELLERAGHVGYSSTWAGQVAIALCEQGLDEEAERFAEITRRTAGSGDIVSQVFWRRVLAKLLARHGDGERALALAREAVALLEGTDALNERGDALVDLADVLELVGRSGSESFDPLERALEVYERKENIVSARKVRERLARMAAR